VTFFLSRQQPQETVIISCGNVEKRQFSQHSTMLSTHQRNNRSVAQWQSRIKHGRSADTTAAERQRRSRMKAAAIDNAKKAVAAEVAAAEAVAKDMLRLCSGRITDRLRDTVLSAAET
jgi:hypothetical protein